MTSTQLPTDLGSPPSGPVDPAPTVEPAGPLGRLGPLGPVGQVGPGPGHRPVVAGVVIVVPVRDEEALLPACLRSIRAALDHPAVRDLPARIVVALDSCRDDSAAVATRELRAVDLVVELDHRNVGATRSAGVASGIAGIGIDPAELWLAHTDADSTVPRHWLARQVALAPGTDAIAGIVRVADWSPHDRRTRRAFARSYRSSPLRPHPHVHGANLGVRASAHLAVGGFPPLACSEDHALWDALRAAGYRQRSSRRVWVRTSARRTSRLRGGFADTLIGLDPRGADPDLGTDADDRDVPRGRVAPRDHADAG